jgi:hypothetical protein
MIAFFASACHTDLTFSRLCTIPQQTCVRLRVRGENANRADCTNRAQLRSPSVRICPKSQTRQRVDRSRYAGSRFQRPIVKPLWRKMRQMTQFHSASGVCAAASRRAISSSLACTALRSSARSVTASRLFAIARTFDRPAPPAVRSFGF